MKMVAALIAKLSSAQAAALAANRAVALDVAGETVSLTAEDVVVQRTPKTGMVVASEGDVIVGIETALTPDLIREGVARELVSRVQNLRKDADFEVTQRIAVAIDCDKEVEAAVSQHADYVKTETLCEALSFGHVAEGLFDLNGHDVKIAVTKIV